MFYSNSLNLIQVGGGTQVKQGDLGSKFSYKLANEKDQEIDDFDKEVAHIDLVLDDKIVFTTTATVDNSTVTFNIDKPIPVGLYFLEIKIRDYIFPSDKQTIIFVQSGAVAYDLNDLLNELVPNYDVNMTLKGILSDLSQKGIDIKDLKRRIGNANAELIAARNGKSNLKTRIDDLENKTTKQLAQKANKDEVTNVITPKGTLAYASLPTSGNQVGWYYYCPDGDGTHGAGNYVWNGKSWFFGGTGDEGYNLLKKDLGEFVTKEKSVNLLNPENIITGYLYKAARQENGSYKVELSENSLFSCAYIDIEEGNSYIATGISYNAYNTDDEGNAIGTACNASGSIDTPTFNTSQKNSNFGDTSRTATRLYFSWRNKTYPTETFMIVEGAELPSTYSPYYVKKYINSDVEIQQLKNTPFEEIKLYVGFGEGENHFNTVVDAFKETEKQEGHYTVYIAQGTYDMFEEYGGLASLQNFDSSVDTPYNTQPWLYNVHVIGCGRVRLTYNPQTDDYADARWVYSPVNIRGEVTLENIEIYCNGGRYCIHDETGGIADYYDKEHVYKNVICETGTNTGRCIGGGCDYGQRYLFENCSFKSGYSKNWTNSGIVSWHNRRTTRGCTFVFNNCKFTHIDGSTEHSDLRFSNVGTGNALSNVYLNNCYFSYGQIRLAIESETSPSDNQYQIICSNCNKQSLLVDESLGDNQYPLVEYNPIN